jgi:hypothetical protein
MSIKPLLPSEYSDTTSSTLLLTGFTVAVIAYTIASHSIYIRAQRLASKAILASLGFLACQMIWAPSLLTGTERLLILLPLSMSVGLSWAEFAGHTRQTGIAFHEEKS